jgi:hypothetical protein
MKGCSLLLHAIILVVGFLTFSVTIDAQSVANAQISGTVSDSTNAVIPGAEIRIVEVNTGIVHAATSSDNGGYSMSNLPVGAYKMEVKEQGFRTYVQTGIELQVAMSAVINPILTPGETSQEVTVTTAAPLVETRSSAIGEVMDSQRVVDLPLNGRDPMQLVLLTGGVSLNGTQSPSFNVNRNFPVPYQLAFVGQIPGDGTFVLDGATHNDAQANVQFPFPFPDALDEFKVETSAVPAIYGLHGAATVNAVTKSGTNKFHGGVFEFLRNGALNGTSPYSPYISGSTTQKIKDQLKRNQFGGDIGGPIMKNKLFFFGAFQDTIVRSNNPTNQSFVPTASMLAGNFAPAFAANCFTTALKAPFVGNMISPTTFSAPSVKLASMLPTPSNACGLVQYSIISDSSTQLGVGKVDYHINDKHSLFGRYLFGRYNAPSDQSNILKVNPPSLDNRFHSFVLGDTYSISKNFVSSFHGNLNRDYNNRATDEKEPTPCDLGVQNFVCPTSNYSGIVSISGAFTEAAALADGPALFNQTNFQLAEDIQWQHGNHQVSFGVNYIKYETNTHEPANGNGSFAFSGGITNYSLADFLLGDIATFFQTNVYNVDLRKNYIGLYAQDSWKASRNITINAGLRWEPNFQWYSSHPNTQLEHFDGTNFVNNVHSMVFPLAPAGLLFGGDAGYAPNPKAATSPRYNQFGPRIGVSYDPRGKGLEVIRAGYGVFYDFESTGSLYDFASAPPFGDQITLSDPAGGFANPWAGFVFNGKTGNPFPVAASAPFPTSGAYQNYPLHLHSPQIQQWNLTFQKQFFTDWSLTLSYLGNKGTHEWLPVEGNPSEYVVGGSNTTANTAARRTLTLLNPTQGAYFADIATTNDNRNSSYNGLIVTLQKRFSNYFTVLANETYSHCTDEGEYPTSLTAALWTIPGAWAKPSLDRGNCTYDHRHILNASAVAQTPKLKEPALRAVVENWQFSPIFTYATGDWLSITTGTDNAFFGINGGQLANQICNPALSNAGRAAWFNKACFAVPTAGTGFTGNVVPGVLTPGNITVGPIGNLRRDSLVGPSAWDFDASLSRFINVTDHQQLQIRADAFNLFNHTRLPDPVTALNSATFGQITTPVASVAGNGSPQDPRILQFAVKYTF